jgi:putative oxidoreductase
MLVQKSGLAMGLGVLFVLAGILKIFGMYTFEGLFEMWGYSQGFRFMVGVIEVLGGLLLLTARGAPLGAAILSVVMFGAMYTHLFRGNPIFTVLPLAVLVLLIIGARNTRVYRSAHVVGTTEFEA